MTTENKSNYKKNIFSSKDLGVLCQQLAMFLKSGILLEDGISALASETANRKIRNILNKISTDLSDGNTLSKSLSNAKCFPNYLINIAIIGEETGTLENSMISLAKYYDRQSSIRNTLKKAILYPSILITMMLIVLLFLSVKVVPVFGEVLNSLGTTLSPVANAIVIGGKILSIILVIFFIIAIFLAIIVLQKIKMKGYSFIKDYIYNFKLFESLSLSNLASSLSATISSGIDMDRALEMSIPSLENPTIRRKTEKALKIIREEGTSFIDAFKSTKLFTGIYYNLLHTGMQSGSIVDALNYVAEECDQEFEDLLIKKLSMIEPISVAVISTLIGLVLISVLFPLLGIMSVISG